MTALPSKTWQMLCEGPSHKELPKGLDAAADAGAGVVAHLIPRRRMLLRRAAAICALKKDFADLSDQRLTERAAELAAIFRRGRQTHDEVNLAYALVREVARRVRGEEPFLVQIAGALALEFGWVVEMATGEGKTLTATLPAVLGGWRGRGCHIVTVNDYLARRDAEDMASIYRMCGLTVAAVQQEMTPPDRRAAYHADITYVTNKEVTADFLRDRITLGRLRDLPATLIHRMATGGRDTCGQLVQRGLHHAIVDEADSILIDEAVTPLIISGEAPNPEQVEAFRQAFRLGEQLTPGRDYRVNDRYREVELTRQGQQHLEEIVQPLGGVWHGARRREELLTQALTARHFYLRDKQYAVVEEKVVIVDEFTGRLMPGREWRDGIHQAVEAKEEITVNPPKETVARISFQRFFRQYRKLSGMTGTAAESWREFWQIYHLPVAIIPTNRPCIRTVHRDRVYATDAAKWQAVVAEIQRLHQTGRPLLVGTRSVRASEHLSGLLTQAGLAHSVLNAVRHAEEAQIIAGAGQQGCITVATNMAGRGTDIKLGRGVANLGGLAVIATERHESRRVDRQLFGRSSRQGDPGSAMAFVSLQDELPNRYAPYLAKMLRQRFGQTDRPISSTLTRALFELTQRRAQRLALRQRKTVLHTDDWLDEYLGFAGSE